MHKYTFCMLVQAAHLLVMIHTIVATQRTVYFFYVNKNEQKDLF